MTGLTPSQYRQAVIELVTELFPPEEQDRWLLTPHSALNGDWPSLAMQKGNEESCILSRSWLLLDCF